MNDYKIVCNEKDGICTLISDKENGYLDNVKKEIINVYFFTNPINEISNEYHIELLKFYLNYRENLNFNLIIADNSNKSYDLILKIIELVEQKNEIKVFQLINLAKFYKLYLNKNINDENAIREILDLINCYTKEIYTFSNLDKADDLLASDINFTNMFKIAKYPSIVMINEKNKGLKISDNHSYKKYINAINKLIIDSIALIPQTIPNFNELIEDVLLISQDEVEFLYNIKIENFNNYIKEKLSKQNYMLFTIKNKNFVLLKNCKNHNN